MLKSAAAAALNHCPDITDLELGHLHCAGCSRAWVIIDWWPWGDAQQREAMCTIRLFLIWKDTIVFASFQVDVSGLLAIILAHHHLPVPVISGDPQTYLVGHSIYPLHSHRLIVLQTVPPPLVMIPGDVNEFPCSCPRRYDRHCQGPPRPWCTLQAMCHDRDLLQPSSTHSRVLSIIPELTSSIPKPYTHSQLWTPVPDHAQSLPTRSGSTRPLVPFSR